jgi:hypothetical protein
MRQRLATAMAVSILWLGVGGPTAANDPRVLGFTTAHGTMGSDAETCEFETTRRAYWVDANIEHATPTEIGASLIAAGAVNTHLVGWALDGRAILTVARFKDAVDCNAGPYPFTYESCLCSMKPTGACDCPSRRLGWPDPPPTIITGMSQVPVDPGHYYFGANTQHPLSQLFRMDIDGCSRAMAGAAGHGGAASPTEKDVYALEGVPRDSLQKCGGALSASPNNTCIVIRKGQEPTYFTDCAGPEKNVYATWSPDGTRLAFARGHDDPYRLAVARWSAICTAIAVHELATAPGLCAAILHNSSTPAWGPESKWLYYATCPAAGSPIEIARVEVRGDGSAATSEILTSGHPQLQGRTLRAYPAPAKDVVAFAAGSPGGWQLYVLGLASPSGPLKEPIDPSFLMPDSFIFTPYWRPKSQ